MTPIEIFEESRDTLTVNKVRTGLAMLGVVIGIGSVIALMSLGKASQQSITSQIQSLGSNLLTVRPGAAMSGGVRGAMGGRTTLTMEDSDAIKKEISYVSAVAPIVSGNSQLIAGSNNTNTSVYGVTPAYPTVNNLALESGTFITQSHITSLSRVAVIGPGVAEDLFGTDVNPVGKTMRIGEQIVTIIGMTASKGGSGMNSTDDIVYVPITVAQKILYGQTYLSQLGVSIASEDDMTAAEEAINTLLLKRHKIADEDSADFRIMNQEEILSTVTSVTGTFTALLSGIAAISLVVGGIGIMNIMLVTVTERTREIGLRKALGAKKKVVINQFLTEAILITVIGGLIGIVIGILAAFIIGKLLSYAFVVDPNSIVIAFTVSVAIGVAFGWYPAQKASNLQPIEALRYE
jgi:putative ABC transport system permease protein